MLHLTLATFLGYHWLLDVEVAEILHARVLRLSFVIVRVGSRAPPMTIRHV